MSKIMMFLLIFLELFLTTSFVNACEIIHTQALVHGYSMPNIVTPEHFYPLQIGYYKCNIPKKDDIVLFNPTGNINFTDLNLVKSIKGVPGDTITIMLNGRRGYYIAINNKLAITSNGILFYFTKDEISLISASIKKTGKDTGHIPENTYLVMGNREFGKDSWDSRKYGLINKNILLGKLSINQ